MILCLFFWCIVRFERWLHPGLKPLEERAEPCGLMTQKRDVECSCKKKDRNTGLFGKLDLELRKNFLLGRFTSPLNFFKVAVLTLHWCAHPWPSTTLPLLPPVDFSGFCLLRLSNLTCSVIVCNRQHHRSALSVLQKLYCTLCYTISKVHHLLIVNEVLGNGSKKLKWAL